MSGGYLFGYGFGGLVGMAVGHYSKTPEVLVWVFVGFIVAGIVREVRS